jgi:hypothetical protein
MARDVGRLSDDPGTVRAIGKHARDKVANENTLNTTAPRLRAVIDKLLGIEMPGTNLRLSH